jgi:hypothetical protein
MEASNTAETTLAPAEPAEDVIFISPALDQMVTVQSGTEPLKNNRGETVDPGFQGYYVNFVDGRLTTTMLREQAERVGLEPEQAASRAIATIRELDQFNTQAPNAIWEEGKAPNEPKPTVDERNGQIARATARRDVPALEAIVADETETHNRRVVIRAAEHAIRSIAEAEEAEADDGAAD